MSIGKIYHTVAVIVCLFSTHCQGWSGVFEWETPDAGTSASAKGRIVDHNPVASLSGVTLVTQCALRCLQYGESCRSFSHHLEGSTCFLFNITLSAATMDKNITFTSFDISDWSVSQAAIGPCLESSCGNHGHCFVVGKALEWTSACYCDPLSNRNGTNCESIISEPQWDEWGPWGSCSQTACGGWYSRTRQCRDLISGGPMDPQACGEDDTEVAKCAGSVCPQWSSWTDWEQCSTSMTCGAGAVVRSRECKGVEPGEPVPCLGPNLNNRPCQSESCDVPVKLVGGEHDGEGYLALYETESESWLPVCSKNLSTAAGRVVCQQIGYDDIYTVGGDQDTAFSRVDLDTSTSVITSTNCTGDEYQYGECYHKTVTRDELPCDGYTSIYCEVSGGWTPWSGWSDCSEPCGDGSRTRRRECSAPGPLHGGSNCTGDGLEAKHCRLEECSVDGRWDLWMEWGECSVTCGDGTRERTRECVDTAHGGKPCDGTSTENEACFPKECPVDGEWEGWSAWSSCSLSCGHGGTQVRNRTCVGTAYGGSYCPGGSTEEMECFVKMCPVDGEWEEWTDWSSCTLTCGNGTRTRSRECVGQAYGGQACTGENGQTTPCNQFVCPVDGTWSGWGDWGECDAECGGGFQHRNRTCEGVVGDGAPCPGNDTSRKPCFIHCYVPGEWMSWGEWELCSVTCGGGVRYKTRECNMTTWGEYTSMCEGINSTSLPCHNFSCTPLETTCKGWKARGLEDNTEVIIHINPEADPFWVHCNVDILNGTGVTMIYHDGMDRTLVKGYESSGEYEILLQYNTTRENIDELKFATGQCRQYISWECQRASISNPFQPSTIMTYWESVDNEPYHYWGGVKYDPNTYNDYAMCACGVTKTCIEPSKNCNCDRDNEDDGFLQDDGYLEYKDHLPIAAFYAGDTGQDSEEGYHKIGPLQCWGDPVEIDPYEYVLSTWSVISTHSRRLPYHSRNVNYYRFGINFETVNSFNFFVDLF